MQPDPTKPTKWLDPPDVHEGPVPNPRPDDIPRNEPKPDPEPNSDKQ